MTNYSSIAEADAIVDSLTALVTVALLVSSSAGEGTGPLLSDLFNTYAATIDEATGEVLNAGPAHW